MSSTDLSRKAFKKFILPLSNNSDITRLAFAAPLSNDSYFTKPDRPQLTRQQMEAVGADGLFEVLKIHWLANGNEALCGLIKDMTAIAQAVEKENKANSDEVDSPSELIYQMF